MILVATPEKPFAYTSKETLRKGYMLGIYAQEIEELYRQFESLAGTDIPVATAKASWTLIPTDNRIGFLDIPEEVISRPRMCVVQ